MLGGTKKAYMVLTRPSQWQIQPRISGRAGKCPVATSISVNILLIVTVGEPWVVLKRRLTHAKGLPIRIYLNTFRLVAQVVCATRGGGRLTPPLVLLYQTPSPRAQYLDKSWQSYPANHHHLQYH